MKSLMNTTNAKARLYHSGHPAGFSLIELLASVAILGMLMAAFFQFVDATQRQHRSNQLLAEIYQGGRNVIELMSQELQQAGYNPDFTPNTTLSAAVTASSTAQSVSVTNNSGMYVGNDVIVDPTGTPEKVRITAVTTSPSPPAFSGIFTAAHASGATVTSAAQPYPTGILIPPKPMQMQFYGTMRSVPHYIEYSCFPQGANRTNPCPATGTTTIAGTTYNLYTLYRSSTPVTFAAPATANAGYPMVDNVVATAAGNGPTGAPVFALQTQTLGSNTIVTRVTIALTLQTPVLDPDSGRFRTVTLRSQVIPRDIVNSISVVAANGNNASILPATPADLPMAPL